MVIPEPQLQPRAPKVAVGVAASGRREMVVAVQAVATYPQETAGLVTMLERLE